MHPDLADVVARLDLGDDVTDERALSDADTLLYDWACDHSVGPLADDSARAQLKESLVACIDRDPRRRVAAKAVWALGKLFDPTLAGYLRELGRIYLDVDDGDSSLDNHVRQTVIALDNLDLVPAFREAGDTPDVLPRVLRAYVDT